MVEMMISYNHNNSTLHAWAIDLMHHIS